LVVLAHEDHAEFADLLAALLDEHRPAGMTERHLIEELATVIWRKRRVLLAEGAKINEGLKSAANSSKSMMSSAAPFERRMADEDTDVRDLLDLTPENVAESQQHAALDLAATKKAAAILRKGGANAYTKARRALIPESRYWWDDNVEDESYGRGRRWTPAAEAQHADRGAGRAQRPGDQLAQRPARGHRGQAGACGRLAKDADSQGRSGTDSRQRRPGAGLGRRGGLVAGGVDRPGEAARGIPAAALVVRRRAQGVRRVEAQLHRQPGIPDGPVDPAERAVFRVRPARYSLAVPPGAAAQAHPDRAVDGQDRSARAGARP